MYEIIAEASVDEKKVEFGAEDLHSSSFIG